MAAEGFVLLQVSPWTFAVFEQRAEMHVANVAESAWFKPEVHWGGGLSSTLVGFQH